MDLAAKAPFTCACGITFETFAFIVSMVTDPANGPPCPACAERMEAERKAREPAEQLERIDRAFEKDVAEEYRWCSFEALAALDPRERANRVKDPTGIERAVAALAAPWILLEGKAGMGKTTLAHAIAREKVRRAGEHHGGLTLIDGYECAVARAQGRLGEEAPAVASALRARFVILDDLCAKPANPLFDATGDIVQHRHKKGATTIITSGFPRSVVEERLGAGTARRLYERTVVIQLKPKAV
jgi:hypothetical protein